MATGDLLVQHFGPVYDTAASNPEGMTLERSLAEPGQPERA